MNIVGSRLVIFSQTLLRSSLSLKRNFAKPDRIKNLLYFNIWIRNQRHLLHQNNRLKPKYTHKIYNVKNHKPKNHMNYTTKIEFSPELEPTLRVLANMVGADTAILYRFIEIENVESAELLRLVSESEMIKDEDNFYNMVIRKEIGPNESWSLKEILNAYKNGTINYEENEEFLKFLKENIRILRFAEYAEKDNEKKIYDFDYTKRPQKYLILEDALLTSYYQSKENKTITTEREYIDYSVKQIKSEGMTAYVVRSKGQAYLKTTCENNPEQSDYINLNKRFLSKEPLDKCDAHIHGGPNKTAYKITGQHNAAWVLIEKKLDTHNTQIVGCLRFEFPLDFKDNKVEVNRINETLQLFFNTEYIEYFNKLVDEVFKSYIITSYEKQYQCLEPIIGQLIEIEKYINSIIYKIQRNYEELNNYGNARNDDNNKANDKDQSFIQRWQVELLKILTSNKEAPTDVILFKEVINNNFIKLIQQYCEPISLNEIESIFRKVITKISDDFFVHRNEFLENTDNASKLFVDLANHVVKEIIAHLRKRIIVFDKLSKTHSLIQHLFIVFKRNTYYGDSIFARVSHFIKDLLKQLNLPYEIFTKIWDNLKKQEELMLYDLQNYRDHFMHQFHVFMIGYIFIFRHGLSKFLTLTVNNYLNGPNKESSNIILGNSDSNSFGEIDVLRIWVLTSLFHDCAYSFEKIEQGFDSFSDRTLLSKLKMKIDWAAFFLEEKEVGSTLAWLTQFYNRCHALEKHEKKADLLRIFLQHGIVKRDHGILSALLLLRQLENIKLGSSEAKITGFPLHIIADIASTAIAIHNGVYKDIVDQIGYRICFNSNPYLFLLIYCDTVQEWGRRRSKLNLNHLVSPRLLKIDYPAKSSSDSEKEVFSIQLAYVADGSEILPKKLDILPFSNQAAISLVAPCEKNIKISYQIGIKENFDVYFSRCYNDCLNCKRADSSSF